MPYILSDPRRPILDHGPVTRVRAAGELGAHVVQAGQVSGQVFEDGGAVSEEVVAREHSALLFEHEGRMVGCVPRAVDRAQGGAFHGEGLVGVDVFLSWGGVVFMDFGGGAEGEEVVDTAGVVGVPVR